MEPKSSSSRLKPVDWVIIGLTIAVVAFFQLLLPLFGTDRDISSLRAIVRSWPENDYGHGYFILPAIVLLLWRSWPEIKSAPKSPSNWGMIWVTAGILLFLFGAISKHFRLTVMALPFLIYGSVLYLQGKATARFWMFPLMLFIFAIPVPGLVSATNGLQLIVTKSAYLLGKLCGMNLWMSGNNINMEGAGDFNVDEGCSGIRSVVALTLIAFVYGYYRHRELWKRLLVFASSIPVAVVANSLRIFSILIVAQFNPTFAKGAYHDYSGFVTFGVALSILLLISHILNHGWNFRRSKTVVRKVSKPAVSPEGQVPSKTANQVTAP
jgi:exosortase